MICASLTYINGLKKVIFASSGGAIYGDADVLPTPETYPTKPVSPYGVSKLTSEYYLQYYFLVYGINYIALRYSNVYGPRQNPFGEAGVVAIFSTKLLKGEQPVINGHGKQTRDYVFVGDVVKANLIGLKDEVSDVYNIGTGIETDVNQLFHFINNITRANKEEKHGPTAAGEQLRSVITSDKLFNKFGWRPSTKLEDGLKVTVEFFKNNLA